MNLYGKTVYLAGKMSGCEDYNFPAFHEAAQSLRDLGISVESPAEMEDLNDYKDGVTPEQYRQLLTRDLSLISGMGRINGRPVDAVVVLLGWEESPGAKAEVAFARALKIPVVSYPDLELITEFPAQLSDSIVDAAGFGPGARSQMLAEAASLVDGDRNADYGDPLQDFRRTAAMWSAYAGIPFQPHDVAAMMALLKLSRIRWSPEKRDSWVDLAGYAACGADCIQRMMEEASSPKGG